MSQEINLKLLLLLVVLRPSALLLPTTSRSGCAPTHSTDVTRAATSSGQARPSASFGTLKQIDAGLLNVGYAEAGPADGSPVLLLHGWPYDIHSFVDVAPLLASAGYRVIVPYLRGYGTTRFLSSDTFRNAQQSAVALDIIALMDALKIGKAVIGAFDWGARTANIIAALWPERCKAMVSVSGYLIGSPEANKKPLPPKAELEWWYQYYFATERGRIGYEKYRREFAKLIWRIASPKWAFDDATFNRSAAAFDNPDHVAIVIHNYRWRLGLAQGEPSTTSWKNDLRKARSSPCPPSRFKAMPTEHPTRTQRIRETVRRSVCASTRERRHRAQSAPGGAPSLCPGYPGRRSLLTWQKRMSPSVSASQDPDRTARTTFWRRTGTAATGYNRTWPTTTARSSPAGSATGTSTRPSAPRAGAAGPSATSSTCSPTRRASACTSATPRATPRPTSWRATSACAASTCCTRWAGTRSACPPSSTRSRPGTHPAATTAKNIATFKRQLKMLGFSYDWSREIDTTDPGYVRWTQWIFLQLFQRGLAYQARCPSTGAPRSAPCSPTRRSSTARASAAATPS